MKKIKKLLCILLCFVLISAFFAGCKANEIIIIMIHLSAMWLSANLILNPKLLPPMKRFQRNMRLKRGLRLLLKQPQTMAMSKRLLLKWQQMKRLRFFR